MEHRKMCRICLMINVKMYSIDLPSLFTAYTQFTGHHITGIYRYVCFECAALLRKCYSFKLKCQKAQEILGIDAVPIPENTLNSFRLMLHSPLKIISKVITDIEPTAIESIEVKPIFTETIKEEINDQKLENGNSDDLGPDLQYAMEIPLPYSDFSDEDNSISKKKNTKKKKAPKVKKKNTIKSKSESNDADDEPLSKISKNKKNKANVSKSKSKPIKKAPTSKKAPATKKPPTTKKPSTSKKNSSRVLKFDLSLIEEFTTVMVLSLDDAKRELELRKESSNYRECSFKCSLCYRGFESHKSFDNHMKKHSPDNGNTECEICHVRVKTKRVLNKHIASCHKNKYSCKICPYVCFSTGLPRETNHHHHLASCKKNMSQVKSHINLHQGIKYTCDLCGEKFSMANSLCMHKRKKHATECVCALCGSTFAAKRGLQGHISLTHRHEVNEELGPKCEDCNVKFTNESAWKRHLVLSSKHKTSNGCEFCGEMFPDAESLKTHLRTHSRKKRSTADLKMPAPCPLCEEWLTDRGMYREHMTSLHPQSDEARRIQASENGPVVCEVCGKRFTMPCFLRYHQRKHTGERPYGCNVCGKTFVFLRTLATHKVVHDANNAKHKCTLCAKRFVFRSVLMKHVRTTHLNVRPHKCEQCGKGFATRCEVKYHAQYVHDKVPWPKRDRSKPRPTDEHKKWLQANI